MAEIVENPVESPEAVEAGLKESLTGAMKEIQGVGIEQGPMVLRLLGLAGGLASLVCAIYEMVNPLKAILHPVNYIMYVYIAVFALTTLLFEVKPDWVASMPGVNKYQDMLMKHCNFMTLMSGRGLFYIFQGTLWLTFADSLGEILEIAAAGGLAFVGLLHIAAHAGIMPHHIAEKARAAAVASVDAAEKMTGVDIDQDGKVAE